MDWHEITAVEIRIPQPPWYVRSFNSIAWAIGITNAFAGGYALYECVFEPRNTWHWATFLLAVTSIVVISTVRQTMKTMLAQHNLNVMLFMTIVQRRPEVLPWLMEQVRTRNPEMAAKIFRNVSKG